MYEYDASFHSFVFECCEDLLPESNESNELDSTNEVILVKLKCLCTLLTSYIKMNNGELAEMNVSTLFCRTGILHWLNLLTYGKQTKNVFRDRLLLPSLRNYERYGPRPTRNTGIRKYEVSYGRYSLFTAEWTQHEVNFLKVERKQSSVRCRRN